MKKRYGETTYTYLSYFLAAVLLFVLYRFVQPIVYQAVFNNLKK